MTNSTKWPEPVAIRYRPSIIFPDVVLKPYETGEVERVNTLIDAPVELLYTTAQVHEILASALARVELDAERLDWMLKHPDATICSGGPHGPYHIWFRYSNRTTDEQSTARAAIDAAMKR